MTTALALLLAAPVTNVNAFYMGHSLMSDIPDMVMSLARASGQNKFTFKDENIPGSPLHWHWTQQTKRENKFEPQFQGWAFDCITSATTDFVLTDSVPRGDEGSVQSTIEFMGRFLKFARSKNPKIRVWYYEGWHCINTGTPAGCAYDKSAPSRNLTWIPRLDRDHAMWSGIVNKVNANHPAKPGEEKVRLIPTGIALSQLAKEIDAGKIAGYTNHKQLFDDDIHLNSAGKYFIGLVHYACLFGKTPLGLPSNVKNRWGGSAWEKKSWEKTVAQEPLPAAVKRMQQIAWEISSTEPLAK